jgi:hypothetical protein
VVGTVCQGNDIRLSDNRIPVSHTHGNISNEGKIGTLPNLPIITGTEGRLQTGIFGDQPGQFSPGNHDHPISKITGLQTALNSKLDNTDGFVSSSLRVGSDPTLTAPDLADEWVEILKSRISWLKYGAGAQILDFFGKYLQSGEHKVFDWSGGIDVLSACDRRITDLGNPVNPKDSVRYGDSPIPRLDTRTINSSTAFAPYLITAGRNVRLNYIYDTTNNAWSPQIVLPKPSGEIVTDFDTVRFGDVFRVNYQPTTARTMNVARYFWNGTNYEANFTNFSTVTSGAKGFCFDGKNWVTEAEFTGL